jgi:hypothetical protein
MIGQRFRTRRHPLLDLVILVTVFCLGIPLDYALAWRIAGVPALNIAYIATFAVAIVTFARDRSADRRSMIVYGASGIWLCIITIIHITEPAFSLKGALQDVASYIGLLAGISFAQTKKIPGFSENLPKLFLASCIVLALGMVGLILGYVGSKTEGGRLVDVALYNSAFFIQVTFPLMWHGNFGSGRLRRGLAVAGIALSLVFAIISATRSVIIISVVCLAVTGFIAVKKSRGNVIWLGGVLLLVSTMSVFMGSLTNAFQGTLISARFSSENYEEDPRAEELTGMLADMTTSDWIYGTGFGRQFVSPIELELGTGLALYPHIGITALLYKGGLLLFSPLILVPCLLSLFRLLFGPSSVGDPLLAGVVVYFFQSCMSGGWSFMDLFLLGLCLELGLFARSVGAPGFTPAARRSGGQSRYAQAPRQGLLAESAFMGPDRNRL